MGWGTETNLIPGAPSESHQTANTAVGFVEDVWTDTQYPCVTARFSFTSPYRAPGGEGNVYLRYEDSSNWIRAQVKLRTDDLMDISVIQNSGLDLSQDPNIPLNPWTTVDVTGGGNPNEEIVHAIEEDGSGGFYIAGTYNKVIDEFSVSTINYAFLTHINSDGTLDTLFRPSPNGTVHALKLVGANLYIGGAFTQIDAATTHGGPFTRGRVASVLATTGEPTAGVGDFDIRNGQVDALEVVASDVFAGGTFTDVQGSTRNFMAKISVAADPALSSWDRNFDNTVKVLKYDGVGIWAGGKMAASGESFGVASGLQRVDIITGVSDKFFNLRHFSFSNGICHDLYLDSGTGVLYIGGDFTTVEILSGIGNNGPTFTRNNAAAININEDYFNNSFLQGWNPNLNDDVLAIQGRESHIVVGGKFTTIGEVSRNKVGEVDNTLGQVESWDPNLGATSTQPVGAIGFQSSPGTILIGGNVFLWAYKPVPDTGLDIIMQLTGVPMPSNYKVALQMEIDCGEVLKTWFMDGITGKVINYSERVGDWKDDYSARVEIGPANSQGPQLDYATLDAGALSCELPSQSAYVACDGPTTITSFATSNDHCPEAYPAIIDTASHTSPRGWSGGVNGLNPPFQRPARWWHELIEPGDNVNGGSDFLPNLTLAGDAVGPTKVWQFSHPWCLGIVGIKGHPSGSLNQDTDPTSARWSNILLAGTIVTTGSKTEISGLSIRIDYKKNAIAVGWTAGCSITRKAVRRAHKKTIAGKIDIINPGTFSPTFLAWQTVSNLDQWSDGLSIAIDMDCANLLTIDMWGTNSATTEANIASVTTTIDPINVDPNGLDTRLLGTRWGVFSFMEGKNLALLDDDANSKIEWDLLTADIGAACS